MPLRRRNAQSHGVNSETMTTLDTQSRGWEEVPGLVQSVWRYKWMVAAAVLLGGLLGYGWASRQPTLYEGVTRVFLAAPGSTPVAGDVPQPAGEPERYLRNQAELISSSAVLERAAKRSGGAMSVKLLRERTEVDVAPDSDVITIRVLDPTPEGAASTANSVATAYNEFIAEQSRASVNQLRKVRSRLEARLASIGTQLVTRPNDESLRRQRAAVLEQLAIIEKDLVVSGAVAGSNRLQLQEKAAIPEQPVQPAPRRMTAIGALFGLVGSGALAWWLSGRKAARANQAVQRQSDADRGASTMVPEPAKSADAVRPLVDTLGRDPNVDWEVLSDLVVRLDATLADTSLKPYFEALPRVMTQEITNSLATDVVALLLDNQQGSFEVAGGMGLSADERDAVVGQDHEALRRALWEGVGVLQDANWQSMAAAADLPGGRTADALMMVPLVQGPSWLGMLLVGRRSRNGRRSAAAFSDKDVKRAVHCAANYSPIIQTLLVARRLQQSLWALRSVGEQR
jgi:capsular polysaccharide biosynthesis protein